MGLNILKCLMIVLILSRLTRQQTTPEERCEETGNGTFVCIDCFRSGMCSLVDGTYTVTEALVCPTSPQTFCDDSISEPGSYGQCSPLPSTYTTCGCSSAAQCVADPNNPAVILHCEETPPVSDKACSPPAVDLTTCSCLSCSDTCPLLDDPDDDCGSYFVCSGSELVPVTCTDPLCFDQDLCGCVDTGGGTSTEAAVTTTVTEHLITSSEPATTKITEPPTTSFAPVTSVTCPPGCPFVDDPSDSCSSYFICSGGELIPGTCVGTLCFDQQLCGCTEKTVSSTESPTSTDPPTTKGTEPPMTTSSAPVTSLTCPPGCPFVDDPNDSCGGYFICSGGELIPATCVGTLCFDQQLCGCTEIAVSSTESPTSTEPPTTKGTEPPMTTSSAPVTSLTCPPGCPFVDDPNDSCGGYFVCSGTELIPVTCTGTLCFDQASCGCLDIGGTSTESLATTTVTEPLSTSSNPVTSLTCPPDCPFLDDPDDTCGKYFVCSGGELVPVTCTGTLCFDQTSCGCVDKGISSTELPTTKVTTEPIISTAPVTSVTCPPDCPFLDDPNGSCGSYFVCSGTELIPVTCPDSFCFDQALCGCVNNGGSTSQLTTKVTETTITSTTSSSSSTAITCSSDCPYVDDPNDPCAKFYICDGDILVPSECPGILCFDQATCTCA